MREEVYSGKIIKLYKDKEVNIKGVKFKPEIVKANDGVNVLVKNEKNEIYLAHQHRFGINGVTYELPGGAIDEGEDAKTAAIRELEEEIGLKAGKIKFLFKVYPSPAWDAHSVSVFIAEEITEVGQKLDEDEEIEIVKMDIDKFIKKVIGGHIKVDSTTLATIYYMKNMEG